MNPPGMRVVGGAYHLDWRDEQVALRLDRLYESREDVKAEVSVKTTAAGVLGRGHLAGPARLNMTSPRSIKEFATALDARMPGERFGIDWVALVQASCTLVLEHYREGEPVVRLADLPPSVPERHRLAPLLWDKKPNLIYGKGGSLKSTLACFWAVLIASGRSTAGLVPVVGPVLYLDYEEVASAQRDLMAKLAAGLGLTLPGAIYHQYCFRAVADMLPQLQRSVAELSIQVIVVDSALGACGASVNDDEAVGRLFVSLRSLECTSLIVAHLRKNQEGGSGPIGSVFWRNYPRAVWEVRAPQDQDATRPSVGLFHDKVNAGARLQPRGYTFSFGERTVTVASADVGDMPDLEAKLFDWQRIEHALRAGPQDAMVLAEGLGMKDNQVRAVLARDKDKKEPHFVQLKEGKDAGKWALAAREF